MLLQIIDESGRFVGEVEKWLEEKHLSRCGFDYSVVTVLGCQSSGKSTLLNHLFGTRFQVMNSQLGRSQTTKGLWLGRDLVEGQGTATIIVDVEGTDSRERGEDRHTFEHRAALFSLAVADLVVINMWMHDIGRATASNYELLEKVLAVNLELFQQSDESKRTVMLFVIRDHSEMQTPLATLETMLEDDIRKIWTKIKKPKCFEDTGADDFFEFHTIGLPSFFASLEDFRKGVQDLRRKWLTSLRPAQYSRRVPADGFAHYCKSVWDTIVHESQLNIPSQKEMLATYRCEEIKSALLVETQPKITAKVNQAHHGPVPDLQGWGNNLIQQVVAAYEEPASRYQETVYLKKRSELINALCDELQQVVEAHLMHIKTSIAKDFSKQLDARFAAIGSRAKLSEEWVNFADTCGTAEQDSLRQLREAGLACSVAVPGDGPRTFDVSHTLQSLTDALENSINRVRQAQLAAFKEALQGPISEELTQIDILVSQTTVAKEVFWTMATDAICKAKEVAVQQMSESWKGLTRRVVVNIDHVEVSGGSSSTSAPPSGAAASEGLGEGLEALVGRECVKEARTKLEHFVKHSLDHSIIQKFQAEFEINEDGTPRHWPDISQERISQYFLKAKEKAMESLGTFITFDVSLDKVIPGYSDPTGEVQRWVETPLLTDTMKAAVQTRIERTMVKTCQNAQIMRASGGSKNSLANVPWWVWLLLLLVGWDELMSCRVFIIYVVLGLAVALLVAYQTGHQR